MVVTEGGGRVRVRGVPSIGDLTPTSLISLVCTYFFPFPSMALGLHDLDHALVICLSAHCYNVLVLTHPHGYLVNLDKHLYDALA